MARTHEKVGYLPEGKLRTYTPAQHAEGAERALKFIEGRWKMTIIFHLFAHHIMRFSELERAILAVSQKMLIQQLREMERDGIIQRTVHPQVPPKAEYSLTGWGKDLCPAVDALLTWGALRTDAPEVKDKEKATQGEMP